MNFKTFARTCGAIKWYIAVALLLFVGGYILGNRSESFETFILSQLEGLQAMAQEASQSDNQELSFFITIFYNNVLKSVFMMFAGIVFAVLPVFFLVVNGMVIGFLFKMLTLANQDMVILVVKGLLPHGIIEIPAILIAAAFGLRFGVLTFQRMNPAYCRRPDAMTFKLWSKKTLNGALWVTVMLLVAAIIESTITLWLVSGI